MIPFVDLRAQLASIRPEIDAAVGRVLDSCQFVLGPEVAAFESDFAAHAGARFGIGVNSGTSALHLALLSAGVGPGDEVITVPFTFVATAQAIRYTGARPVLVDVDPKSFTMDPSLLDSAITARTRAIVPVHIYGHPCDMDLILETARRRGVAVIEDACQAHGARYKGRRVGAIGDLGCFSFYPGKNLGGYGEGGSVVTRDPEHARRLRMLRDWGAEKKYQHAIQGFNYRMDALQGAILRVKLAHLDRWTMARRAHAARYSERLTESSWLAMPKPEAWADHVFHIYAVRSKDRARLIARLDAAGIGNGIHYPIPVHLQGAHADLGYRRGDFPVSEALADEVVSLPMYAELSPADIDSVSRAVNDVH